MKDYIKIILLAMLYTFGGAILITLILDPKENETLVRVLNILWSFLVYFSFAIPAIEEIRNAKAEERNKDMKDTLDDET
jgi:hypothetical protein